MDKKTLVYEMWPISWGSIRAMTAFLPRIAALEADYVWVAPIYTSPWGNHGYDVADYYSVDRRLGSMADMDEFIRTAHVLGLKVIMDLIIDSTSTEHIWFLTDPQRYIWSNNMLPDRRSMMDADSAWVPMNNRYYLALTHPAQANLNWFKGGVLDRTLMEGYKAVMRFWLHQHDVDGFRIGSVQSINQDTSLGEVDFSDTLTGQRSVQVVSELSNLYVNKTPFLMMDVIDPTGEVAEYYAEHTDVEFITNKLIKSAKVPANEKSLAKFKAKINKRAKNPKFMLDLESHESDRFTALGLDGKKVLNLMFTSDVSAICLYQGQELGLKNPTFRELPFSKAINLDARMGLHAEKTLANAESLMQNAWANNRIQIPLDEYTRQEQEENSTLKAAKDLIHAWKHG